MDVKIKKVHPEAVLPVYASAGAACFDLHALLDIDGAFVWHGEPLTLRTGLAIEVPEGHVMLIFSRSGHGFKFDTRLANCVGVIDSDYRGELKVKLTRDYFDSSHSDHPQEVLEINHLDRVAQAMIIPVDRCEFTVVEELSSTERGELGFGSTGNGLLAGNGETSNASQEPENDVSEGGTHD